MNETKYALNTRKGTTITHPDVTLPGLTAVPVNEKVANQVKHLMNVIVFDKVVGREEPKRKEANVLYGVDKKTLEVKSDKPNVR